MSQYVYQTSCPDPYDCDLHVYYNAQIVNSDSTPKIASYNDIRYDPLIDTPNDYHLIVVRAEIDSSGIPLYIHQDNGLASSDLAYTSAYRVYLEGDGHHASAYVKYVSESNSDPNQSNRYVFSIQHFIMLVNTALNEAFVALDAVASLPTALPPYITYNQDTTLFSLVCDKLYVGAIGVFMNSKLWSMFGNFEYKFYSANDANGKDYEIIVRNRYNNSSTTQLGSPYTDAPCYVMTGEYVVDNIKDLDKLILTTGTIPVAKEFVPALSLSGQPNGLDTSMQIITDFLTNEDSGTSMGHPLYLYLPTVYRLIDLVGTTPVSNININVMWQSKDGTIRPVIMNPYSSMCVKLMFQKKYPFA